MVLRESGGSDLSDTVRATVTKRVAPRATTKRLGASQEAAILPAATDDLHHNGDVPYPGDKAAGLEKSS